MKSNIKKIFSIIKAKRKKIIGIIITLLFVFLLSGLILRHYIYVAIHNAAINLLDTQMVAEFMLNDGKKSDIGPLMDIFNYYSDGYEAMYIIPEKGATITLFEDNLSEQVPLPHEDRVLRKILNFFIFEEENIVQLKNFDGGPLYMDLIEVKGDYYIKLQKTVPNKFFVGDIALYKNVSLYLLPIVKSLFEHIALFACLLFTIILLIKHCVCKIFITPVIKLNEDIEKVIDRKKAHELEVSSKLSSIFNKDAVKIVNNLNILLDYLRRVNNTSKEFIAEIVHETKNPINNIVNLAEMNKELLPESSDDMDLIIQQGLSISSLLDGLRDAAENIVYKGEPEICNTDPIPILKELVNSLSAIHLDKDFQLNIIPNFQHRISMCEKSFELVVSNILSNAVKFSEPNTPIKISVTTNEWNWVSIRIENKGPGIPADQEFKIFDKYHRVEFTKNKYPGSGLGLWLVKQIIDMHGCYIFAQSMDNTTGFRLILKPTPDIVTTENPEDWKPQP